MKNSLFFLSIVLIAFISCSKDKEVAKAEYTPTGLDVGHIIIKINEVPSAGVDPSIHVTSIQFTNITTGIANAISKDGFTYIPGAYSYLSVPLVSGHKNDQVQCCINFDNVLTTQIGIAFQNINPDSVVTT